MNHATVDCKKIDKGLPVSFSVIVGLSEDNGEVLQITCTKLLGGKCVISGDPCDWLKARTCSNKVSK